MKRDPLVPPEAASPIDGRYGWQVDAMAAQADVGPGILAIIRAVGALVFFDLLRAYEASRWRRTDHSPL